MQAYNFPHALGLVTFASDVRVDCDVTPLFEDFRDKVKNIQEKGDTKLWDAIGKAAEMLEQYGKTEAERRTSRKIGAGLPTIALRIVVLSDGKDTKSTEFSDRPKLLQKLQNAKITVDSIQIGTETSRELLALSHASYPYGRRFGAEACSVGGYAFQPTNIDSALQ